MKIMLSIFIFLLSLSSAAQSNGYPDGSYYNDDYIRDEVIPQPQVERRQMVRGPIDTCESVAVGEPSPYGNRCKPPHHIPRPKKRKPAGGFIEVDTRGRMGDFKDVSGYDEENPRKSPGSR